MSDQKRATRLNFIEVSEDRTYSIGDLVLDRPEKANAFCDQTLTELTRAIERVSENRHCRGHRYRGAAVATSLQEQIYLG